MVSQDPVIPRTRRWSVWLPGPQWVFVLLAAPVISYVGLPLFNQRRTVHLIEHFNGSVQFHERGPGWLRDLIGRKQMEWFEEPWHVVFWPGEERLSRLSEFRGHIVPTSGPLIDDAALSCVLGLPNLKSLDVAFSGVGDAGVDQIAHLQNLESLRLEGTDVTDLSVPILSRMRSLKELNVRDTKITESGSLTLEAALPGCDMRGPHNDPSFRMRLPRNPDDLE